MDSERWSLVLADDAPVDVRKASRVVAKALAVPLADATRLLRYARGTLLSGLEEATARSIHESLSQVGIAASPVAESRLVRLPRPRRVPYVEADAEALRTGNPYERVTTPIPWSGVRFLSLGRIVEKKADPTAFAHSMDFDQMVRVKDEEGRRLLRERVLEKAQERDRRPREAAADRLVAGNVPKKDEIDRVRWLLDLVLADGARLRMDLHEFCYTGFVPDAAGRTSQENFALLVSRVAEGAREAARTPATARYLDGKEEDRDWFESVEEFERYTDWAYFVAAEKGEGAAYRATGDGVRGSGGPDPPPPPPNPR
ncbi:MAG: hypothetical protein HY720_31570, partial [Planctomycetes bacterium]|nr:hypothetical protein [Planctomycetota bacterium]